MSGQGMSGDDFQPAAGLQPGAPDVPVPDLAPGLENWFLFDETEDSYEISGIAGRIPEWLRGTWYINGPARFERAGTRYKHWLDGDGMVCALRFGRDSLR